MRSSAGLSTRGSRTHPRGSAGRRRSLALRGGYLASGLRDLAACMGGHRGSHFYGRKVAGGLLLLEAVLLPSVAAAGLATHDEEPTQNGTVQAPLHYTGHSRRLQVARPKSYFVEVTAGTCESNGHAVIEDGPECKQAAELWGFKITWGPNGGFHDVVDGCSIRFKEQAFIIKPEECLKGSTTPDWVPGANGKATCTCTDWQPCICRAAAASGWGSAFLLVLTLIGLGYFGGGLALGSKQGRKPAGSGPMAALAIHPHCMKWHSLMGLVSDGVAFSRSRGARSGTRGGGGYSSLAAPVLPPVDSPKQSKKSKKQKSEKSREAQNVSDERPKVPAGEAVPEPPVSTSAAQVAARATTAGDVRSCPRAAVNSATGVLTPRALACRGGAGYTCQIELLSSAGRGDEMIVRAPNRLLH